MKKLIALIMTVFIVTPIAKADTIFNIEYGGQNPNSELWYLNNLSWSDWSSSLDNSIHQCNSRNDCYNSALEYFSSLNYEYYSMYVGIYPTNGTISLVINPFNFTNNDTIVQSVNTSNGDTFIFYKNDIQGDSLAFILSQWSDPNKNNFYLYYDSNYNFVSNDSYIFKGFYDTDVSDNYSNMLQVHNGDIMPKLKDLMEYNSWSDYENNHLEGYTEVNLDNYEYVILSLKDYSTITAFQTNLQVKGQIGITPVYNFGQTSKDSITGVQVQDRCNISYDNYTTYPFYIIQSDIQNNAIFYVKSCELNSSFKFDSTIFNIEYVTQTNLDSPTVTINGKTYNTIPYDDLPSTATKNEEDNYIPGESGSATDTGGIDSAIKNAKDNLSSIWDTFTYFISFVSQLFNSLPPEISGVLITGLVVSVVLGLIKIFTG